MTRQYKTPKTMCLAIARILGDYEEARKYVNCRAQWIGGERPYEVKIPKEKKNQAKI